MERARYDVMMGDEEQVQEQVLQVGTRARASGLCDEVEETRPLPAPHIHQTGQEESRASGENAPRQVSQVRHFTKTLLESRRLRLLMGSSVSSKGQSSSVFCLVPGRKSRLGRLSEQRFAQRKEPPHLYGTRAPRGRGVSIVMVNLRSG